MARSLHVRLDEASAAALDIVRNASGMTDSEAVRTALREAAARRRRRSELREEVARLAADPEDTKERRAVMADMDAIAAGWPE